jgi:type III restriction enzyme
VADDQRRRAPGSKHFTRGFLVVTPGLTIKDRLRVLQPNDPDSYYASRELVPNDMLGDLERAKIVITNYHAFKLRERVESVQRAVVRCCKAARRRAAHLETEGQMLQRVMPDLMGMKNILVLNDEAHHCYREKPPTRPTTKTSRATKERKPRRTTRPRASGFPARGRQAASSASARVIDLSATPFFLAARATPRARCSPGP